MDPSARTVQVRLAQRETMDIGFTDITLTVNSGTFRKEEKEVLKGLSGRFKSGELTAIMGPSGAGKSSLLNILTGFHMTGVGGRVWRSGDPSATEDGGRSAAKKSANGRSSAAATTAARGFESCYIMQEDHLNPLLTLRETMDFAARLKIGTSLDGNTRRVLLDDILDTLGLGGCKETKCSNLSGGQRKRLSIALELIDNPPVMFLDEPTTGLDSSSSLQLVSLLVKLARGGRSIICSIHQPSAAILGMFDHLYFIGAGHCLYRGRPANIVAFLQSVGLNCPNYHNPADFLLEVVTGEFGDFTDDLARAAKDPTWRIMPKKSIKKFTEANDRSETEDGTKACVLVGHRSELGKIPILVRRCALQLHRDWGATYVKLCLHLSVSLLLGLAYREAGNDAQKAVTNLGYLLATMVFLCFSTLIPASLNMPEEVKVLKKEYFNKWYKFRTYYIAFLLVHIPLQVFFCFVHVTFSYYLTGQIRDISRYFKFVLVTQLMTISSQTLGLSFGVITNPVNGVFVSSVVLAVLVLFAGYLVIVPHMPAPYYYLSYGSYMRHAFEGMALSLYGFGRRPLPCSALYCHFRSPDKLLQEVGLRAGDYWRDVGFLTAFCLLFAAYSYLVLNRKVNSRA